MAATPPYPRWLAPPLPAAVCRAAQPPAETDARTGTKTSCLPYPARVKQLIGWLRYL